VFQEWLNIAQHDICPLPAHVYETSYYHCTCTPLIVSDTLGHFVVTSLLTNAAFVGWTEGEGLALAELRER